MNVTESQQIKYPEDGDGAVAVPPQQSYISK
jgi:hypothetical protein